MVSNWNYFDIWRNLQIPQSIYNWPFKYS